ncbi:type IV toxin-antitoxin system AbiEi family antitoxin domain-containing protein [Mycobacterium sp. ACS4331]|uniref:type IV toxin-antitoxin system AbiEi family antitoxin domain-containing protein n=1 Tax=Mycobacterium sp. ACS4331 TaxID=1834121 RepID=UPI0007FBBBCB|nr:type IV toxin-antitoxin system AbiEi family antitoxin domain-containing protein [Mycobacterium sp. ACS4331]OBF27875.1 hypothetical protein A5727_01970 [Mycobacterium sp. ACS4331]
MFTDLPFELLQIFARQGSVATFAQMEQHLGRRTLQRHIRTGVLVKIWPNIYCWGQPTQDIRLNGLNLRSVIDRDKRCWRLDFAWPSRFTWWPTTSASNTGQWSAPSKPS